MKLRIKEPIFGGEKICPCSNWRKSPQIGCMCVCVCVCVLLLLNPSRLIHWTKIYLFFLHSSWLFFVDFLLRYALFLWHFFKKKNLISVLQALKCNMGIPFSVYLQILFLVVLKKYKRMKMNNGIENNYLLLFGDDILFLKCQFFCCWKVSFVGQPTCSCFIVSTQPIRITAG